MPASPTWNQWGKKVDHDHDRLEECKNWAVQPKILCCFICFFNLFCLAAILLGDEVLFRLKVRSHNKLATYGLPRTRNYDAPSYNEYMQCVNDPACTRFGPKKNETFLHDYPGHPWHWTRENEPDERIGQKKDCKGSLYRDLYQHFHQHGFAIFESCSLKRHPFNLLDQVAKFSMSLENTKDGRVTDAPNRAVKALSIDPDTLEFLEYVHGGRRLFPFQTLNFHKGTQQALHSDLIHFDTSPRTLMTAAWVALEDMSTTNGPLQYVPGSHLYGTWDYDEVGIHDKKIDNFPYYNGEEIGIYSQELQRLTKKAGLGLLEAYTMKKGQTFVSAAGLVHGGSPIVLPKQTRLAQLSHYFFEGSDFYWIPRESDLAKGQVRYKTDHTSTILHRCHTPEYIKDSSRMVVHSCADSNIQTWKENCYHRYLLGTVKVECEPMPGL